MYEKLQEDRYPDEELQTYITNLGNYMVSHSEMADEPWTFTVLESPPFSFDLALYELFFILKLSEVVLGTLFHMWKLLTL